jgi:hypothetical protein
VSDFALWSWAAWAAVVAAARLLRGKAYATFRAVSLALHVLVASALASRFDFVWPLFVYLHASVFLNSLALARPRMRPLAYRVLVSVPSAFFAAGTLLAWPWAVAAAFGWFPPATWAPYLLAAVGVIQSLTARREEVDVVVADGKAVPSLRRHEHGSLRVARALRIVQITDPHLGPFMSVKRLRRIAARAVEQRPDLVFLTGDFLTMESQSDPDLLADALAPLTALDGRVFACLGNHDHEAPLVVGRALRACGVRLLVDESSVIETSAGTVQVVGSDFAWRDRKEHLARLCVAHPRVGGALRILLLHDPGAFRQLPEGEADLVLSGHTHGGQVGLVSLGLPYTMLRVFMKAPDHGFWARGTDRLYVHRGTGHYGFPLRLGVPAEESVLSVHAPVLGSPKPA